MTVKMGGKRGLGSTAYLSSKIIICFVNSTLEVMLRLLMNYFLNYFLYKCICYLYFNLLFSLPKVH